MREDTPQHMNTSPSHQCTLPLVTAQMVKNSAASLTWYLPAEGMSPVPDHLNYSGYETQTTVPADVNADQDSFQDKDRQKTLAQALEKDLNNAPWQKGPAANRTP